MQPMARLHPACAFSPSLLAICFPVFRLLGTSPLSTGQSTAEPTTWTFDAGGSVAARSPHRASYLSRPSSIVACSLLLARTRTEIHARPSCAPGKEPTVSAFPASRPSRRQHTQLGQRWCHERKSTSTRSVSPITEVTLLPDSALDAGHTASMS